MGAGGGGWGLGFLLRVFPLQTWLLQHTPYPGTEREARPRSGPRCSQGASRLTTHSHFNFPSCLCVVGGTPSTNPYSEANPWRRPRQVIPLLDAPSSLQTLFVPTPRLLNLTRPEALTA